MGRILLMHTISLKLLDNASPATLTGGGCCALHNSLPLVHTVLVYDVHDAHQFITGYGAEWLQSFLYDGAYTVGVWLLIMYSCSIQGSTGEVSKAQPQVEKGCPADSLDEYF